MKTKHLIAGLVTVAAIGGGTAGAIAATDDHKATEQAVISDAAKRLGVSAEDLRTALGEAEDAQIDAAVKAGKLTQAQADALKQRRKEAGTVLGLGPGRHGGGPGFGIRMRGGSSLMTEAAKALGISESTLMQQLRDGKTLESIAKANNKSLDDVKAALKAAATKQLDADLKAGRITQAQHDDMADHLDDMLDHLGQLGRFGGPGGHRGPGGPWGGPDRP